VENHQFKLGGPSLEVTVTDIKATDNKVTIKAEVIVNNNYNFNSSKLLNNINNSSSNKRRHSDWMDFMVVMIKILIIIIIMVINRIIINVATVGETRTNYM
jgi:ATP-dependent Zn protease